MNIVIIGGGNNFGKEISKKFKYCGDNVYILSHINYYNSDERHTFADFSDIFDIKKKLTLLLKDVDHIDILLYASNFDYGPHTNDYKKDAVIDRVQEYWQKTFNITVIVPHIISVTLMEKMSNSSKIVFMTSSMSLDMERTEYKSAASYAGCKAAQNHLMISLAALNDSNSIVYSIATHLPKDDIVAYNLIKDRIFEELITFNENNSGKIINIF